MNTKPLYKIFSNSLRILGFLTLALFFSCSKRTIEPKDMVGTFVMNGHNFSDTIAIFPDSSFIRSVNDHENPLKNKIEQGTLVKTFKKGAVQHYELKGYDASPIRSGIDITPECRRGKVIIPLPFDTYYEKVNSKPESAQFIDYLEFTKVKLDTTIICDSETYRINLGTSEEVLLDGESFGKTILVKILKQDSLLSVYELNKHSFGITDKEFLSKAVIYNSWFEGFDCNSKEFRCSFSVTVPETDWTFLPLVVFGVNNKQRVLLIGD